MHRLAASIGTADRLRLADEVRRVVDAGVDAIHLNVIDADDRPNLSMGHMVCAQLREHCAVPIGVQLRVPAIDALIERFAEAGADLITVHPGVTARLDGTLALIRRVGCQVGLAFDSNESLDVLARVIEHVDLVHVSCASPASAARTFVDANLRQVERARQLIAASGRPVRLQVDGSISADNIRRVADAGADDFVVGRAIFGAPDYKVAVDALRAALQAAPGMRAAA